MPDLFAPLPRSKVMPRILLALLLLVAAAASTYGYFWFSLDRRLQARVAQVRTAGEPLLVADFATAAVAEAENAGPPLAEVHRVIARRLRPTREELRRWREEPASLAQPRDGVIPLDLLRELRQQFAAAVSRPACDWGVRLTSPMLPGVSADMKSNRELGQVFNALARHEAVADDDGAIEALSMADDLLRHAPHAGAVPTLVASLIECALERDAAETIKRILAQPIGDSPKLRSALRRVLDRLNDEGPRRARARRAYLVERAVMFDVCIVNPTQSGPKAGNGATFGLGSPVFRPLRQYDMLGAFDDFDRLLKAIDAPSAAEARQLLPAPPAGASLMLRPLSGMLLGTLERSVTLHHSGFVDRRRAALLVAQRLFELERGRAPASPEELVPEYLRVLHADALAEPESQPAARAGGREASEKDETVRVERRDP